MTTGFNWEQFEEVQENEPINKQTFDWEQFEEVPKDPLAKEREVAKGLKFFGLTPSPETVRKIRQPLGLATRALVSSAAGSAGDLLKFGQNLLGIKDPVTVLPTSEQVGDFFTKISGEDFKPESLGQEYLERSADFLGSILGLGGPLKGATALKTLGRNVFSAIVPAGVSLATEKANLPPWVQIASTAASSFLTHRLTGKGLNDIEKGLYKQANIEAKGATVPAKNLAKEIETNIKKLKVGGEALSDKAAIKSLKDMKSIIKGNKASVEDLMTFKRKLNEARSQLFTQDLGKAGIKVARKNLNSVAKLADNAIEQFNNPEFQKTFKQASQLHAGIAQMNKTADWLKGKSLLYGPAGFFLKSMIPNILGKSVATVGTYQLGKMMKTIATNPGYRKAYFDILKNAAKEDLRTTAASVKRFNKKTEELK